MSSKSFCYRVDLSVIFSFPSFPPLSLYFFCEGRNLVLFIANCGSIDFLYLKAPVELKKKIVCFCFENNPVLQTGPRKQLFSTLKYQSYLYKWCTWVSVACISAHYAMFCTSSNFNCKYFRAIKELLIFFALQMNCFPFINGNCFESIGINDLLTLKTAST